MKKKKKKIKKPSYPKQLSREDYFKCPIWFGNAPEFVDDINKASDSYIDKAKKNLQPDIDKRNKTNNTKGDLGSVYHSTTLIGDPKFKTLTDYIGATSHNLLLEMGFDMSGHRLFTTEMWVQEFAKSGGGRMIFFPSYMPHQYIVDLGVEPFRFIHWNCQAIPKGALNVV